MAEIKMIIIGCQRISVCGAVKSDACVIKNQRPVNVGVLQDENSSHVVLEVLAELFVLADGIRDPLQWEFYQTGRCMEY